jgi:hypothetical protein
MNVYIEAFQSRSRSAIGLALIVFGVAALWGGHGYARIGIPIMTDGVEAEALVQSKRISSRHDVGYSKTRHNHYY